MAIIRYPSFTDFTNPFREMARLQREMDRVLSAFTGRAPAAVTSGVFPALNITSDNDNIYVHAEIPGIKPEDLDISVEGNTLTIRGGRQSENVENVSYHRRERRTGRFQKAVTLPDEINAEAVKAQCNSGALKLVLPKAEQAKPRKITVKSE